LTAGAVNLAMLLPAAAGMRVMESTTPAYSEGQLLADDSVVNVPEGSQLRVLHTDSGESQTIVGPYSGTADDYEGRRDLSRDQGDDPLGGLRGGPSEK
jgi:hypothetical protein